MARIFGLDGRASITIRPGRVTDEGNPRWISTDVEAVHEGADKAHVRTSSTEVDLLSLSKDLAGAVRRGEFSYRFSNMDENLHVSIDAGPAPNSYWFGVWLGEADGLSRGFRILAKADDIDSFARSLSNEVLDLVAKTA